MGQFDTTTLTRLFQSKNASAKVLGLVIVLFMFFPQVFRIAGDDSLTIWQRLEQLSLAAGQTLFAVAVAAVPPDALTDSDDDNEGEEEEPTTPV